MTRFVSFYNPVYPGTQQAEVSQLKYDKCKNNFYFPYVVQKESAAFSHINMFPNNFSARFFLSEDFFFFEDVET